MRSVDRPQVDMALSAQESTSEGELLGIQMDIDTQSHLRALRELLTFRRSELRAEVNAARSLHGTSAALAAHDVTDRKDEAATRQSDTIEQAEEARDLAELSAVEAALNRLDRGEYEDCADCGEPIGMQRLLVQPAASRCAACQEAFERACPGPMR